MWRGRGFTSTPSSYRLSQTRQSTGAEDATLAGPAVEARRLGKDIGRKQGPVPLRAANRAFDAGDSKDLRGWAARTMPPPGAI